MIIAVNTRLLLKNKLEGIGWFAYESLKRITQQHKEHKFIFIFDREYDEEFIFSDNITPVVIGPTTRHAFLWYYWFEFQIPKVLKKHKADLFLSPDGFLSLSTDVKSLNVIHDLNFEHYPNDVPYFARRFYKKNFPKYAQKAKRIATVSNYSKNDIAKTYCISPEKIDVVYNGSNEIFSPVSEEIKKQTKIKYTNNTDYFIYVGSMHPRKNISRLLKAFDEFKKTSSSNIKLLIVGEKMWWANDEEIVFAKMQFRNDVVFTGRLNAEELKNVYASALALTYVPYFEGFGIPLAEAMYSGIPIITSNITSMPEVVADAALLVDPFSIDSIKNAMLKISADENLRKDLIEKGNIRKQNFSWQKTADGLWDSIEKCL